MASQSKPWSRSNPRKKAGKSSKKLTPSQKASAKAKAKRAGRPYPNLVDNMRAASKKKTTKTSAKKSSKKTTKKAATKKAKSRTTKKKTAKKKTAAKRSTKKSASQKSATKDPKGGLTAAGRKAFAKSDGANLKPGVRKPMSEMTPQEMKRKGSWAVRFYGRDPLPPLVDDKGQPTRLALSAHAWGEPVPKTEAAARKIAAKGERLLARYEKLKD